MDDASNKCVSVGVALAASPVRSTRKKQAFADVNTRQDAAEELDGVIAGLRNDNLSLREQLAKESSEKLEAINCHLREKEGRIAAEKLKETLFEDLEKCKQEIFYADRQIAFQKDLYNRLQECNTSVQQRNSKLQKYLLDSIEDLKRVEDEKLSIIENLGSLREQLAACKTLGDEAIKHKESFAAEVKCLREELQQVREDRDNQRSQVEAISADMLKYQESTGKYHDTAAGADAACLENATVEFTKEEVEALLNYRPKIKKFDHKANAELMSENNKRLRLCVKWFQRVEETHLTKQQVLQSVLDSAEEKEIQMAKRLEELDGVIAGLRNDNLSLQEQLAKESSEKPIFLHQEYIKFINGASKEELKGLKGIGEKRACQILELREMSPEPFKQLDDLQNIGLSLKHVLNLLA